MKTEIFCVERMSLEEFADLHGLVMEVRERENPSSDHFRFYANFRNTKVVERWAFVTMDVPAGTYGNGDCPETAVRWYADLISGGTIVLDPDGPGRLELKVPRLRLGKENL